MLPGWQLPGWQRWMKLDRRCFYKPDVTRLAATRLATMDEARSEMLLQTGCYQVGSDGRQPTLVTVTRKCACRIHILCNGVSCYIPPTVARTQMCPKAGRTRVRATKNKQHSCQQHVGGLAILFFQWVNPSCCMQLPGHITSIPLPNLHSANDSRPPAQDHLARNAMIKSSDSLFH